MTRLEMADDGFLTLEVSRPTDPPGTAPTVVTIDVFDVYNSLRAVALAEFDAAEKEGRPAMPAERNRDLLNERFQLGCSAKFADKLFAWLKAEVERVQKKDRSPNSVETPGPSDSPSGLTTADPTHLG